MQDPAASPRALGYAPVGEWERNAACITAWPAHEFAWGNVTPPVRNPWDTTRVPSGSSGGTGAAVAARFCPAGMGSDTGGSIRMPAAACGIVGLKPTFGRVSRDGIVPHSWSLDHAGPLTRTVADAAHLLQVLAGYDALSDLDLIAPSEFAPLGARMEDADIEWGLLARIIWK